MEKIPPPSIRLRDMKREKFNFLNFSCRLSFLLRILLLELKIVLFFVVNSTMILGRPRRRWEDNIKLYLQEVGFGGMEWIELAQDRDRWWALVNTVMNLRVP
jgi:hypothetical protein